MLPRVVPTKQTTSKTDDTTVSDLDSTTAYLTSDHYLKVTDTTHRDVSTYFTNGKFRIDYVIVYEYKLKGSLFKYIMKSPRDPAERMRKTFIDNLRDTGLRTETMVINTRSHRIYFVNIHVPWLLLVKYAELLSFKVPFQEMDRDLKSEHWSYGIFNACKLRCFYNNIPDQPRYFITDFSRDKIRRYIGSNNTQTFFTTTQRNTVAYEILQETTYGEREAEKGLDRLLKEKIFNHAFPLHDGDYKVSEMYKRGDPLNHRQTLFYFWASWHLWHSYQPLNEIRMYFGEKAAFYFALVGFYTSWLVPLAIVGVIVFIAGLCTVSSSATIIEVCKDPLVSYSMTFERDIFQLSLRRGGTNSTDTYPENDTENAKFRDRMCPLCDTCNYWELNKSCINFALAHITDHPGVVFYAFFTSLWAVMMLRFWTRLRNHLSYTWNCYDIVDEEERPRARYLADARKVTINPVTGLEEPSYPKRSRVTRSAVTSGFLFIMVAAAFIFFVGIMLYRALVSKALMHIHDVVHLRRYMVVVSGLLIHFCAVQLLNYAYAWLAYRLTDWEIHRTQSEYENHLSVKLFIFESINNYSPKFYIAFFKGRFSGYPGHYNRFLGARLEKCDNDTCSSELALNVCIFFIGNLIANNFGQYIVPLLQNWYFRRNRQIEHFLKSVNFTPQWLDDYCRRKSFDIWKDYMSLVTQFGYVTIFVAAFPIAPLLALLNNCVEIRLDAKKYLVYSRRVLAQRVSDIGIWHPTLKVIVHISVITNGFIIAFTLDFLPKVLYMYEIGSWDLHGFVAFSLTYSKDLQCRYYDFRDENGQYTPFYWKLLFVRVMFVFVFEHFIFFVMHILKLLIPEMPEEVEIQRKRERYLAKRAFMQSQ